MHNTGEKTNPGPLGEFSLFWPYLSFCGMIILIETWAEHIINQNPLVHSSIIFGRGQFHAGVIIDPRPEFAIDPEDQTQLDGFRDKIW